ncbi:MAG: OmpA family protein [Alcanivoracaceae bacterium]|nr:OmpA family protein [Alcanivoracaceae bacterium]
MSSPALSRWLAMPLVALCAAAHASSDAVDESYVSGMALFIETGDDRNSDDGLGVRGLYGKHLRDGWFLELGGYAATIETGGGGTDTYTYGLGADLAYRFGNREGLTPFLLAGAGMSYNDIEADGRDDTSGYVNAGAGVLSGRLFGTQLRARAEARYVRDNYSDDLEDIHIGIGLEMPLGRIPERVVEKQVVITDTREVPVNEKDSDNDSVPDSRDDCPGTLDGARVDARGCLIGNQVLTLRSVNFVSGSAQLLKSSEVTLVSVATALEQQPDLLLSINGHTDSQGTDEANLVLSQQRANSVRDFLIAQGIDAARLQANGFGEQRPVADNDTREGRAMNRRVEFELDTQGE